MGEGQHIVNQIVHAFTFSTDRLGETDALFLGGGLTAFIAGKDSG